VKVVCQRLVFNLDLDIGKFYAGKIFFPANHYYISGDEIEKTGADTYYLVKGRPPPATARIRHGRWTAAALPSRRGVRHRTNARLSTQLMPVLYTPWVKIPVKSRRQSGF
jgi:LPS-assembly protein